MAHRYFFILGNTPILSSAECAMVFSRARVDARWLSISDEVLVVETAVPLDPSLLMTTLGGTVKIGRILPDDTTTEQWVRSRKQDGRLVVGVSVYKAAIGVLNARCAERLRIMQGDILLAKRALKEEGRSLRLVTTRDRVLPSVALVTEHIIARGGELVALVSHQGIQLGETIAVQQFHEYRHRDMGRPSRDARRGMLPPKVAQMMVNLAGAPDGGLILDPFCGSGTVLQEATLLGYKVVGSDIERQAIEDTKKNLAWLKKDARLFVSDIRYLRDHIEQNSIDAIVTEPYLGPPLTGRETPQQLVKIRHAVTELVHAAFKSFRDVLRPGGRVVIVFPVYQRSDLTTTEVRPHALLPIDAIEKLGWRLISVIPEAVKSLHTEGSPRMGGQSLTSRDTILYSRADQHLAREITVWTRG